MLYKCDPEQLVTKIRLLHPVTASHPCGLSFLLYPLHCYILLLAGKLHQILSPRTSFRSAPRIDFDHSRLPCALCMIAVSRFAMRDPSVNCADSRRDVQSPSSLPTLA